MARRRRRHSVSSSESSEEESSEATSSAESSESESQSSLSSSESDESSEAEDSSGSEGFDDTKFPDEDPKKVEEEVRDLIRQAKLLKFENQIIERAGIDNYTAMRDCDDKKLKRLGMGYSDRERLLKKFRERVEELVERNREKYERQKELQRHKKKSKSSSSTKRSGKRSKSAKSSSRSKSKSKSSRTRSKSKSSKTSRSSKGSKTKKSAPKIDPDEALRKLDTGWSGKKQAWKDYKEHEARVAELMEFYDEIGKKRANPEEHARKLLVSYPGGIDKLVIALDKKYHHIPYGWEEILEEALKKQQYDESASD